MSHGSLGSKNNLKYWLMLCAAMIVAMMSIGAITRLTESGLSITEWNVISGALPPMGQESWVSEFAKYQKTPEFAAKHAWMELDDFKKIYFWEWLHRLWGRLIGLVFAGPMIWFWVRGDIARQDRARFAMLLILGASQGALGWFMVKSGLVDRPDVSHFRLAAHFGLAVMIYGYILVMILRVRQRESCEPCEFSGKIPPLDGRSIVCNSPPKPPKTLKIHALLTLATVFVTMIWGAMVAGLDGGMIYNQFPLMGDHIYPPEWGRAPLLTDPANVQFIHRVLALITALLALSLAYRCIRWARRNGNNDPKIPFPAGVLGGVVVLQLGLGIATILSQVALPLAVAHQLGGVALFSIVLILTYKLLNSKEIF